ncbi:aberrant root formation protein 4 isoform X2 [Lolium perenne]|uniref:aberrant root formation protein 4 isoform X2 n=1 Tax=Lolium perenne TaxID=4522 RepID=UPI0021F623EC|nr:aberrant root formation protein 4 isoform X2 [Lolium perenne]
MEVGPQKRACRAHPHPHGSPMASGDPFAAAGDVAAASCSSSPTPTRLREALAALSEAFESGDTACSDAAVAAVSGVLSPHDAGADALVSEQMLREVHAFLSCPSSNQMAIDALSLELPKSVAELGARMGNCRDIAKTILDFFALNCNPRDMLSILCEALDTPVTLDGSAYLAILLDGLARVLTLIQRRHIEQVRVVLPAVLRVIHTAISEPDVEHGMTAVDMFNSALGIGSAIQEMCKTMVNHRKEELCSILGLYALQIIALVSESTHENILHTCGSVVLQYSKFLTFCGFTYLGLLTGNDVASATNKLSKEEDEDFLDCFSFAMDGASLVVMWTSVHDDMSKYAGAELESALKRVQDDYIMKWKSITTFRYVLSSVNYPWAIERVMITAPDALMRKKAFAALKRVISVVPSAQRFDILQALITSSMFPSLTAILLDLVKNEVLRESRQTDRSQDAGVSPPWASHALELVELILRPPEGGSPCLRDHSEQVLSALNLLRLILILDSRGSRAAKLFQDETIRKVHTEWLIPLRPTVAGILSELEKDGSKDANQIMCLLNPVQLVLQRCTELVEEKMKG